MSKTLMLYYTFTGNTEFVSERMKELIPDLTVERLIAENEPPKKGFARFLFGGAEALFRRDPALFPVFHDPNKFEKVILAFPVWAGTYPPAVAALFKKAPFRGKKLYIIACSSSGRAEKAIDSAAEALSENELRGSLSLRDPLSDRVGSIVRIASFARFTEEDE